MILMWLGSIALMMFGFFKAQAAWRGLLSGYSQELIQTDMPTSPISSLLKSSLFSIFQSTPERTAYAGLALFNLRHWQARSAVLLMCTGVLGCVWMLFLAGLFANLSGALLMGVGSVWMLSTRLPVKAKAGLQLLFFVGLFLVGGEVAMRSSSILQTYLGQSSFAFFLADGRFSAVLVLLLAALVLTFILDFEYWSLVLALNLVLGNVVSLNGALALVAGEMIARKIIFAYRGRSLDAASRSLSLQFAIVGALALLIGFFIAGETRTALNLGFSLDFSASRAKLADFVFLIAVMHGCLFFALMIWGHFAGNKTYESSNEVRYVPPKWWARQLFTADVEATQKKLLNRRLSEIRYHVQGLESIDKTQIPAPVLIRLQEEEQQLAQCQSAF